MASLGLNNVERTSATQISVRLESQYRLLEWKDLQGWQQDNKYITSGYRGPSGSFRKCLRSLKRVHNETINIYSHLLGVFLFLGLFIYVLWRIGSSYATIQDIDYIVFTIFFIGIITCFFLSAFFHTIANHSEVIVARGVQLDYIGIVLLIWGATIPSVYYGLYCEPNLQKVYWVIVSLLAFACIVVTFSPGFRSPQLRPYRAIIFTTLGVSAIISMVHGVLINGWVVQNKRISFKYIIITAGLDLVAAVIYSTRIPERWQPIQFDIYGHSHQLLHIITIFAGLIYLVGLLRAIDFAHSQSAQCV